MQVMHASSVSGEVYVTYPDRSSTSFRFCTIGTTLDGSSFIFTAKLCNGSSNLPLSLFDFNIWIVGLILCNIWLVSN